MLDYRQLDKSYFLTPKIVFFFVNVQYYAFYNFRGVFAKHKVGMNPQQFGSIMGFIQLITFFTTNLFAFAADKTRKPKTILATCLISSAIVFQLFYADTLVGKSHLAFSLILLAFQFFIMGVQPLLDRIMLDYLTNFLHADRVFYGTQRMWGTFSYALTNFIVEGKILYSKGEKNPNFGGLGVFSIFATMVSIPLFIFLLPSDAASVRPARESQKFSRIFREKEYLFFLSFILLCGITRGSMTQFLTLYYKESLKLPSRAPPTSLPPLFRWLLTTFYKTPVSTCNLFGIILEVAILFASKPILNVAGLHWPLLLSQFAQLGRFLAYLSLTPDNPLKFELSCLIELLKGLSFGLVHISGVQLATRLVTTELISTSQTVYTGTFVGLASFIGSQIGALFYQENVKAGYDRIFISNVFFCILSIVLFVFKYGMIDRKLGSGRERIGESIRGQEKPLDQGHYIEEPIPEEKDRIDSYREESKSKESLKRIEGDKSTVE